MGLKGVCLVSGDTLVQRKHERETWEQNCGLSQPRGPVYGSACHQPDGRDKGEVSVNIVPVLSSVPAGCNQGVL